MASQSNYFAYNIIDDLYYGTPAEEEMENIYGKIYHRRNEFNNLTPEQQENFDEEEKEFIQAVINKYVTGNNKKISYVGKYDENQNISYTYINPNSYMPIQLSDMISNVNGMHLYKLISAKDIDFDNVILPNSVITRDFNWGIFDEKRRWGNKPIHINNTFELLNVIDYLLCACNNIWNELYKLKYKEDDGTNLWFVTKADSPLMILESKKISGDDFKKEFIGKHEVKLLTTLDPTSFYSTVKTINNGLFGFGTNFHKTETDTNDLYFQYRILNTKASKNIVMGDIEFESLVGQAASQTSQTVNGELYTIYGYKIDDDLKLYPGERIKSFVNESCVIIEPDTIVDNTNKKLKYDTYFRMNQYDTYKEVHIEFLYNYITKTSDNKNLHSTVKHPYILYYINNNDKKQILYVHTLTEEECYSLGSTFNHSKLTSEQEILGELNKHNDYDVTFLFDIINNQLIPDTERFTDTTGFFQKDVNIKIIKESEESTEIKNVPIFYIIPDEYSIEFEVTLPKTNTSKGIVIYYYKNENNIKGDLYITKDKNHIVTSEELNNIENSNVFTKIDKNVDIDQQSSLSYCLERYNIPEDYDIYLKLNATYVSKGNNDNDEINNPLHLKLSDEYKDVALYTDNMHNENIDDAFAQKYYYYDSISHINNYKRNFINYQTAQFFTDNVIKYINYDLKGNTFYHVWEKIDKPYELSYTLAINSLISQETPKTDVVNEVNQIKPKITQLSYNLFKFNHVLNEDIEQIKFDIDFKIDETSKVKKCQYKYPINLNKIYNLSINYIGKKIIHNEIEHYYNNNKYNYYIDNGDGIQGQQPEYLGQIYNNIGKAKYLSNSSPSNPNSGIISYTDVVKELTGNDLDDLNNKLSYDNTDNDDKIFNITYNQFNKYINLFGSFYTGKKLEFRNNASNYAEIKIGNNGNNLETNSTYLFNINGFGKNYRLHGYNNYIYYPNNDHIIELSSYFDVMSIQTSNNQNSINKFLNIKLQEDNEQYQLSYISYLKTGDDDIWTKYDNDFKIGLEKTEGNYVIKTIPVDIIKTSYSITLHNMEPNKFDETITYYIPVSYMIINSSTFYPPLNSVPEGEYDLNKETDIAKYQNYVTCWNSDSNYRPITLSLKLFENINNVSPYFYESNEAKMKFNILRSNELINNIISVDGIQESIFISLDSRHYLSDFIRYRYTDSNSTGLRFPCGSYMYYDEDKYSYMIKEIYSNDWVHGSDEHNIHYSYVNDSTNTNTALVSNIENKFQSIQNKKFLYPIFKKSKDDNNYNYDIYRVSDINKLMFDKNSNKCTELEVKLNETSNNVEDTCIHTDYNVSYIDFLSDDINSFFVNNQLGTCILKNKILNNYYCSKNYNSPQTSTVQDGKYLANIIPIYRIKNDLKFGLNNSDLYPNITINGVTYEFFTFIYDDIYLVRKEGQTIQDTGEVLFKKTNENVQDDSEENIPTEAEQKEYYEKQLYYFLNYEEEDHQNNTIKEYLLCNKEKLDYLTAEEENEGE